MDKIESVNQCHVCHGTRLKSIPGMEIEDFITGEIVVRLGVLCLDCDTIHYVMNGDIQYEFSVKFINEYEKQIAHKHKDE